MGLQLEAPPPRTLEISFQGAPYSWDKECLPHPWTLKALHGAWHQGQGFRNYEGMNEPVNKCSRPRSNLPSHLTSRWQQGSESKESWTAAEIYWLPFPRGEPLR